MPLPPPDWRTVYEDPDRPLVVDVGCGSGRFLLALSQRYRSHNCLGLDIRQKVHAPRAWCKRANCNVPCVRAACTRGNVRSACMAQLIDRANSWTGVLEKGGSVRFMMANATVSLEGMLAAYPGPLSLVTVQVWSSHL